MTITNNSQEVTFVVDVLIWHKCLAPAQLGNTLVKIKGTKRLWSIYCSLYFKLLALTRRTSSRQWGNWEFGENINPTLVECPIQLFENPEEKQPQGIRWPNPLFIALSRFQGREDPPLYLNSPDCAFCETREWKASAGKDSQQGQFNFWGRSRGNWHSTSPKHSHFHSYTQILNFVTFFTLET